MLASGVLQCRLEELAAHSSVDDRVPVHKLDGARRHRLRELVHSGRGLLRVRPRDCCKVSDTLNSRRRLIEIHTSRREGADVSGHLREVVDRLVGIGVEFTKRCVNILERRALGLGVSEDRLNRVQLSLVLLESRLDRVYGQRLYEAAAGRNCTICDPSESGDRDRRHSQELAIHILDGGAHVAEVEVLSSGINVLQALLSAIEIQSLIKSSKKV